MQLTLRCLQIDLARQKESVEFVKKARFSKIHVFPYSQRTGTAAADMKQIPIPVREERAKKLSLIAEEVSLSVEKDFVGTVQSVLFETTENGFTEGLTGNYMRVFANEDPSLEGKISLVKIEEIKDGRIYATII